MYKLRVHIYSNHVPFDARQKCYGFKSLVKFGTCQQNLKITIFRGFSKNHAKSSVFAGILFENIQSFFAGILFENIFCRNSF